VDDVKQQPCKSNMAGILKGSATFPV